MSEHDDEPIRGLPGHLPEGEHILWQGAPEWKTLAFTAMRVRWFAAYFTILATWNLIAGLMSGEGLVSNLVQAVVTLAIGAGVLALLALYAWLNARTTVYTLTNRRFVLRHGVALSKAWNIPYARIGSAGLKVSVDGTGDIPLALTDGARIAYPLLWPHARPFRFSRPEPMIRAVKDVTGVAEQLSLALQQAAREADRPYSTETPRPAATHAEPVSSKTRPAGPSGQPVVA